MNFLVKGFGAGRTLVLECVDEEPAPIAKKKAFVGRRCIGEIIETIGRVEAPLYILAPASGVELEKKLIGRKVCVNR